MLLFPVSAVLVGNVFLKSRMKIQTLSGPKLFFKKACCKCVNNWIKNYFFEFSDVARTLRNHS